MKYCSYYREPLYCDRVINLLENKSNIKYHINNNSLKGTLIEIINKITELIIITMYDNSEIKL